MRSFNGNKYGYQGSEKNQELGANDYYTHFRGLDVEVGRWKGVDPKNEEQLDLSPYISMNNNPVSNIDPLGDIVKVHGNIYQKIRFWTVYALSGNNSQFKQNVNRQRTD